MIDPAVLAADLAWPLTLLIAWAMGEVGQRWLRIPRISLYATVGFLLASPQLGYLPPTPSEPMRLLANIAFGLIIFEAGYRINLRWLRANPWIAVTSLAESALSFGPGVGSLEPRQLAVGETETFGREPGRPIEIRVPQYGFGRHQTFERKQLRQQRW